METKDSIANLASFGALSAVMANIESILTVVLLVSAIVLNLIRMRIVLKNKDTKKEQ
tara:strand:- start:176 stop:346 length:171 start_codon:yes stop_codon:yes gene_type:complete